MGEFPSSFVKSRVSHRVPLANGSYEVYPITGKRYAVRTLPYYCLFRNVHGIASGVFSCTPLSHTVRMNPHLQHVRLVKYVSIPVKLILLTQYRVKK